MKCVIIILIFFLPLNTCAQTWESSIDSLKFNYANGAYSKALKFAQISLRMADSLTEKHSTALHNIATIQFAMGKYNSAIKTSKRALCLTKLTVGANHSYYGQSLNNIAVMHSASGQYDSALTYFAEALLNVRVSTDSLKPPLMYAVILDRLATFHKFNGAYAEALPLFLEALDSFSTKGKNHIEYATCLKDLGCTYLGLGKFDNAMRCLSDSKRILEEIVGKEHPDYAAVTIDYADFCVATGQFTKAEFFYLEALQVSLKTLGRTHPEYMVRINNLASLYYKTGNFEDALDLLIGLRLKHAKKNLKGVPAYFSLLNNIGAVYEAMEQPDSALYYFSKCHEMAKSFWGTQHPNFAQTLSNRAHILIGMHRFDEAERLIETSRDIITCYFDETHPRQIRLLNMLAYSAEISGADIDALIYLTESSVLSIEYFKQISLLLSERELLEFSQDLTSDLAISSSFCLKRNIETNHVENFNKHLILKGFALGHIKEVNAILNKIDDEEIKLKYHKLLILERLIDDRLSNNKTSSEVGELELTHQYHELKTELLGLLEGEIRDQYTFTSRVGKLGGIMVSNHAYIDICKFKYWNKGWTDTIQYVAYIVLPNDTNVKMAHLGAQFDFQSANLKEHRLYQKQRGLRILRKQQIDTNALSNALLKLAPYLKDIDTIYFSPSGIFSQVNVAALLLPDGSRLWDHYHVEIKSSVRELLNEDEKEAQNQNLVLFGGLQYGDHFPVATDSSDCFNFTTEVIKAIPKEEKRGNADDGIWSPLYWTDKEVQEIQYIGTSKGLETKVLSDSSGSETAFKALDGQSPYVLHLATHGYFFENPELQKQGSRDPSNAYGTPFRLTDDPMMRSGLILSGANRAWKHGCNPYEPEDGILTAREISHLDLSQTELVVLSACQTGLGDIDNSEGVYGLQRAFKMAGVNYIIMSLWSVPDQETSELMIAFYRNWLEKEMSLSDAFYTAQKAMATQYPKQPELWAGFVLMQ